MPGVVKWQLPMCHHQGMFLVTALNELVHNQSHHNGLGHGEGMGNPGAHTTANCPKGSQCMQKVCTVGCGGGGLGFRGGGSSAYYH